jgi:hypothetical protein
MLVSRSEEGNTQIDAEILCGNDPDEGILEETAQVVYFRSYSSIPSIGQELYSNNEATLLLTVSDGTWWGAVTDWGINLQYDYIVQISSTPGIVEDIISCLSLTTTTTTSTSSTTTTTTTVVPLLYHMEMSVNDTVYDFINEENIPFVSPVVIETPIKAGFNYLFLSIPVDKTFIIEDSLGTDVSGNFSIDVASGTGGIDDRVGYHDNYIYKNSDVFASAFSTTYTLTII